MGPLSTGGNCLKRGFCTVASGLFFGESHPFQSSGGSQPEGRNPPRGSPRKFASQRALRGSLCGGLSEGFCGGLCRLLRVFACLRKLEKAVAVRNSLLEKVFPAKFSTLLEKFCHRSSGSTKYYPCQGFGHFSGNEKSLEEKSAPPSGNAPGLSPLRPPQPS